MKIYESKDPNELKWDNTMKLTNNPNEPQRITLDIVFKVHHEPFNESHARALLANYLASKGMEFNGENILI